jgi:hypothetical protein
MTYTETKGHKPINWVEFVRNNEPDLFMMDEWDNAEHLATNWETNPVGQLPAAIPRYKDGRPKDRKLRQLGNDFHFCFTSIWPIESFYDKQAAADEIILEITLRGLEILGSMIQRRKKIEKRLQWWFNFLEGLRTTLHQ